MSNAIRINRFIERYVIVASKEAMRNRRKNSKRAEMNRKRERERKRVRAIRRMRDMWRTSVCSGLRPQIDRDFFVNCEYR